MDTARYSRRDKCRKPVFDVGRTQAKQFFWLLITSAYKKRRGIIVWDCDVLHVVDSHCGAS